MMEPKGKPHPSGKPVRVRIIKGRPMWRIPDTESNVPRLRIEKKDIEAIGFVHFPSYDDE